MTADEKVRELSSLFQPAGIEDAVREAELLVTETLHISKVDLLTKMIPLSSQESAQLDALAKRRASGEPIQYIIGSVEFFGLKINVGPGVLIPRPETELLAEEAVKALSTQHSGISKEGSSPSYRLAADSSKLNILDLCTGSGCIALAIAKNFPQAKIYGVDRSEAALQYANQNAEENRIQNVIFMQGDLYEPVEGMRFDLITSNPPYIPRNEIPKLQREIKEHEPLEALDGGVDGLDFYRRILGSAHEYLSNHGLIIVEIGVSQGESILNIAAGAGLTTVRLIKDYAGIERIFIGEKGEIRYNER